MSLLHEMPTPGSTPKSLPDMPTISLNGAHAAGTASSTGKSAKPLSAPAGRHRAMTKFWPLCLALTGTSAIFAASGLVPVALLVFSTVAVASGAIVVAGTTTDKDLSPMRAMRGDTIALAGIVAVVSTAFSIYHSVALGAELIAPGVLGIMAPQFVQTIGHGATIAAMCGLHTALFVSCKGATL